MTKAIKAVTICEIKTLLRTKEVLITMIIVPILIYTLLTIGVVTKNYNQSKVAIGEKIKIGVQGSINSVPTNQSSLVMIVGLCILIGVVILSIYMARKIKIDDKNREQIQALLCMPIQANEIIISKYIAVVLIMFIKFLISIIVPTIIVCIGYVVNKQWVVSTVNTLIDSNNSNIENIVIVVMMLVSNCVYITTLVAISMHMFSAPKTRSNRVKVLMSIGVAVLVFCIGVLQVLMQNISREFDEYIIEVILFGLMIFCIGGVYRYLMIGYMSRERVLFGIEKKMSLKEKRCSTHNRKLPSAVQAILIFYIVFIIANIIVIPCSYQVFGIVIPVLAVLYCKHNVKETFSFHLPKIHHILGGICLWITLTAVGVVIDGIMMNIFPTDVPLQQDIIKDIHSMDNIFLVIGSIAIMPAIGEEMLFRGFMLSGLRSSLDGQVLDKKRGVIAILVTGIIFGIIHIEFRVIPNLIIMGLGFGYMVYKSNSIYISMLLHGFNNAYCTLLELKPEWIGTKTVTEVLDIFIQPKLSSILLLIVITIVGILLLNIPSNKCTNRNIGGLNNGK